MTESIHSACHFLRVFGVSSEGVSRKIAIYFLQFFQYYFFLITYLPLLIEFTFFPINYRLKDYLPSTLYALNAILNILHVLPHSSSQKTSGHFFHGRQKEIVNKTA